MAEGSMLMLGITLTPAERLAAELSRNARSLIRDLVAVREDRGMSKTDVAEQLGRHKSAVTRFESLANDPRLSTVLRYAHAVDAMVNFRVERVEDWGTRMTVEQRCRPNPLWMQIEDEVVREPAFTWREITTQVPLGELDRTQVRGQCAR